MPLIEKKQLFSVLTGVFLLFTGGAVVAHVESDNHLSKEVVPQKYTLSFAPDFNHFTFTGTEKIKLTVHSETHSISLNALDLKIEQATIRSNLPTLKSTQQATIVYDTKKQRIVFHFSSPIMPGEYSLNCAFTGILNDQLRGFYRSSYGTGKKHWLAATQMEPADARRMFPCFDEPNFKAIYQITAIIDPHLVAISNAPILTETIVHGKKNITFEETPPISTYLVALMVGKFRRTDTKIDANGVPISVWTTPGKEHLGYPALEMALEILPMETQYFGIPYPGKKLDLIALPDFSAGAMENLGAITFREEYLLFDEKTGTSFRKQIIASIEAHEIAHQWFGDLVTMQWWDDLWLNEAFATWMATKTIETLHPTWRFLSQSINDYNNAKDYDQLQSTRAINAPVLDPADAREMFDTITYEKGAALLRMLEYFVGEKTFQQGVHAYLKKRSYKNATTHDLWTDIASAAKQKFPVDAMMNSWVYQAGLPLLSASLQQDGQAIQLEQTRFLSSADAKPSKEIWQIPVVFDAAGKKLFSKQNTIETFQTPQASVFVNKHGVGFFRVRYSQHDFNLLAKQFPTLSPEEKLVFLSDTIALAIAGKMPVENALNLMLTLQDETDPLVQLELAKAYNLLIPSINTASRQSFEQLIQTHFRPLKNKLGWRVIDGEPILNNQLREAVIAMLGTYGQDRQTIDEANALFHQYLHNQRSVDQNIVPAMLQVIAYNGAESDYQAVVKLWKSAKNPEDKKRFRLTLTQFNQPSLIAKTLSLSISSEIRGQDRSLLLSKMLQRNASRNQAWTFIKQHWTDILNCFPEVELKDIPASCDSFNTLNSEQDLQSFFAKHPVPYARSAVARMLEKVHINALFQDKNAEKIRAWCVAQTKNNQA